MRPLLLDLFCGAGGAAVGYHRAGFDVVGVDIDPQPWYPFAMIRGDAIGAVAELDLEAFAAIHASPPCQAFTTMGNRHRGIWPNLIGPVRDAMSMSGLPWVLENVPGARSEMVDPHILHGGMFGLGVYRPRLFDTSWWYSPPDPCPKPEDPVGVYGKPDGRRLFTRSDGSDQLAWTWPQRELIGMGHVDNSRDWHDVAEAIPPAYTEHIGRQLIEQL